MDKEPVPIADECRPSPKWKKATVWKVETVTEDDDDEEYEDTSGVAAPHAQTDASEGTIPPNHIDEFDMEQHREPDQPIPLFYDPDPADPDFLDSHPLEEDEFADDYDPELDAYTISKLQEAVDRNSQVHQTALY